MLAQPIRGAKLARYPADCTLVIRRGSGLLGRNMLANRLRAARRDKRITLAGLGSMLGPPRGRTAVCEWEQGRCEPSLATVEQLAAVLNVSPCWLAFGDGKCNTAR